jgi:hypothetical protein
MKIEILEIIDVLCKQGWQEVPLPEEAKQAGLTLICISPFAALGLVLVNSTAEINSCWADCQEQMSRLRNHEAVGKIKDLYLAFVAQKGDAAAEAQLQSVLGDTHVCRKLYLIPNGQTIRELIQSIPCLQAATQVTEASAGTIIPLLESLNLPQGLKRDLATRSPAAILKKILDGKYKQQEARK